MHIYELILYYFIRRIKTIAVTATLCFMSTYVMLMFSPNGEHKSLNYYQDLPPPAKINRRSDLGSDHDLHNALNFKEVNKTINFLDTIDVSTIPLNRTAFGNQYQLYANRTKEFDFPYIVDGKSICKEGEHPFLVMMVPSVHTHIDTRLVIRNTWGRAAKPGLWPKFGTIKRIVKLVFLFGTSKTALGNSIVKEESRMYGDVVQADFVDSYFNLTYKSVMGLRWAAQFCRNSKFILKADEDVFVHVKNLIDFLEKSKTAPFGVIYGHALLNSDVLREGRWSVTKKAFPLKVYPTYTCGNTYVIPTHMAANIYYTAGLLPYLNIEDVFVTGIVRTFLRANVVDVVGFTHWFEKRPRPCEFKNSVRISATKVSDYLQSEIWEGLKMNLTDCYKIVRGSDSKARRPERGASYQLIRDDHIFQNKSSGKYYVL